MTPLIDGDYVLLTVVETAEEYLNHLEADDVPKTSSSGSRRRLVRLIVQLPAHDLSAMSYTTRPTRPDLRRPDPRFDPRLDPRPERQVLSPAAARRR